MVKVVLPGEDALATDVAARSRGLKLPHTFASLRHPNYRLLWYGTIISNTGDWMDQIALNWLVYQLSDSAVDLGLLNAFRFGPILVFTLVGGVVADRWERRKLLFTTQASAMLLALLLAVVTATGIVQMWMVFAIAVGRGVMLSFNQPARQSLISDLVPREDLRNAIALNSATINFTRVLGPTLGGLLIATVGVAGAFYLNGATFLGVLYALVLMRFPERVARSRGAGMMEDLVSGLRYLRGQPSLRVLVMLALVPFMLGMPYNTMLTVFAKDVLNVGADGLGLLTSCTGIGALSGALFVASRARHGQQVRTMFGGLLLFGTALITFSFSPWLPLSVAALILVGVGQQVYLATNNALVQMRADEVYRGRVLSTLQLNRSMMPLGTLMAGFGTSVFGVQSTIGSMAALLVMIALYVLRFTPLGSDPD